uniref:ADF-H domain-containing protein n=1 Tax=Steinernema glaseri TaxID=37863 RepID=A0A1I7YXD6_9BILA
MSGKCKDGTEQLKEFLKHRMQHLAIEQSVLGMEDVLVVCSKEECDFIDKEYRHNHHTFPKPSCVYKYEEGEGAGVRRLYISFKCCEDQVTLTTTRPWRPANYDGHKDLRFMRGTSFLRVMFA